MSQKTLFLFLFVVHLIGVTALPILIIVNGIDHNLEVLLGLIVLLVYSVLIYRTIRFYKKWRNSSNS